MYEGRFSGLVPYSRSGLGLFSGRKGYRSYGVRRMCKGSAGIGKGPPVIYSESDRSPSQSDIGVGLYNGLLYQLHEYVTDILQGDDVITVEYERHSSYEE